MMKNYTGEIVHAVCESVENGRVIAIFDQTEKLSVSADAWKANPGDDADIYIDGCTSNGIWVGSVDKIAPLGLWQKIESCHKNNEDIEVCVVSAEERGLVCDVCSLMGYMPKREIEETPAEPLNSYVGKKLSARILKFSGLDGSMILSHKAAVAEVLREKRESLLASLKPDQIYKGTVKQIMDYGAFVDIGAGVEGLVHRSNLSWGGDDPAAVVHIGEEIEVKILSVEQGKIALGRKQLIPDAWLETVSKLNKNDIVDGTVTTFASFGAFVRIADQVEGLVHNSELFWDKSVRNASDLLKLNDAVRVCLLDVDTEKRRISLSLKRAGDNPWEHIAQAYPQGTAVTRKITSIADFGIFVDLEPGIRALIHRSDIPGLARNFDLNSAYYVGDDIDCFVKSIDAENQRISLEIHSDKPDPWNEFLDQKPLGQSFEVTIQRFAKFGAFASIGELEGLIHISEIADHHIDNAESVLKIGQVVSAVVINIDEKKRRIGLSLTAAPFTPEDAAEPEEDAPSRPTLADIFPENLK